jgi:hypothetical protein
MRSWGGSLLSIAGALGGCGSDSDLIDELFTDEEWRLIENFSPLGEPPPSPTNRYADDLEVAAFGQMLFFEKGYTGPLISRNAPIDRYIAGDLEALSLSAKGALAPQSEQVRGLL